MIYILLGILIVIEIISGIEVVRSVNRYCNVNRQSVDERANVSDSDLLSAFRGGISSRSSDQSTIDREEALTVLDTLRIGASVKEKAAIDYAPEKLTEQEKTARLYALAEKLNVKIGAKR